MRRWIKNFLGRWRERRILTKEQDELYRAIMKNKEILENGGII